MRKGKKEETIRYDITEFIIMIATIILILLIIFGLLITMLELQRQLQKEENTTALTERGQPGEQQETTDKSQIPPFPILD